MDDVLTQDEVDSLFGDDADPATDKQEADATGARPYDLAHQERIVRGRMPTLEIINERFARNARVALFNFMHRTPEISISPVRVVKYSAFLRELSLPTNLNIVTLKTLRGSSLFVFEPTLIFGVIEVLFGGTGKIHTRIEGREFTSTEQRIIQRLLESIIAEYMKAWASCYNLQMEYLRSEMHPQFVSIATPSEVVVTTKFDVDLGHAQGAIHIVFPYASLEPIRDILVSAVQADTGEPDHRWAGLLQHQVQSAEVEVVVPLTTVTATLKQLMKMRPGDVLAVNIPPTITANVDGIPLFEGRPGTWNGKYAIRIERALNHGAEFKQAGDKHAG